VPKDAPRSSSRRQPVPQPQRSARTRRIVRVLLLMFAGVIVVDALVGERGLLAMRRAQHEREGLIAAIARVQGENERLREVARRLREDPAAIEEVARRELGMIRPGEKVFIIKDLPSPGTP
jgi:cell division protein FtsB